MFNIINTMSDIDISGIDKVELLRQLWKHSVVASFYKTTGLSSPSLNEIELKKCFDGYIDYLCGRVIKTDISKNKVNHYMYDMVNGYGLFEKIVDDLKSKT